ncbi:MAG: radical SAM protein [Euryarchaeota archaeon]|nr:radical SAM protein [Euryarchaeota archaeon]
MILLPNGSATNKPVVRGCALCEEGAKMVLFVTGICKAGCFYCPLSSEKMDRDVVFADEMPVRSDEDVLLEAKLIDARGTGITGGDPMESVDRVVHYIRLLKENFGEEHHIHLYTATGSRDKIFKLADAGLDEIRFHPPPELWSKMRGSIYERRINWAREAGMDVGIEVPVLPDRKDELIALVRFANEIGVFVNLNELEFSETNYEALNARGYEPKSEVSSAVKGSEEVAYEIVKMPWDIVVHYCSSSFKDGVQMRRRLMRRAKNIKKEYEELTEDATLILGVIEGSNLNEIYRTLREEYEVPENMIAINLERKRVEISPYILEELAPELPWPAYEVEEYPTWDRLQVERLRLN